MSNFFIPIGYHLATLFLLAFLAVGVSTDTRGKCFAQTTPAATPKSTPKTPQEDPIKVYTEEVLLPVFATDSYGRVDPAVELDDLLVLEDGVPQIVKSVRRLPASILLLLDTAGAENPAMRTSATRELAVRLVSQLRNGDQFGAVQFGGRVEVIQDWTTERAGVIQSLKNKLFSGSRSRLAAGLAAAAAQLQNAPVGNRHVVLISDGGDAADDDIRTEMVAKLLATQATVHVISYTLLGRNKINELHPKYGFRITREKRKSAVDISNELTRPPDDPETLKSKLHRQAQLIIETDWRMWARSKEFARILKKNEQWLGWLAERSGGSIMLPHAKEELPALIDNLARDIDAQYLVTYTPKDRLRLCSEVPRRIEVVPRRVGLYLRSRRSYIVPGCLISR